MSESPCMAASMGWACSTDCSTGCRVREYTCCQEGGYFTLYITLCITHYITLHYTWGQQGRTRSRQPGFMAKCLILSVERAGAGAGRRSYCLEVTLHKRCSQTSGVWSAALQHCSRGHHPLQTGTAGHGDRGDIMDRHTLHTYTHFMLHTSMWQ